MGTKNDFFFVELCISDPQKKKFSMCRKNSLFSRYKKKMLATRKKIVLSLYQDKFSWHQTTLSEPSTWSEAGWYKPTVQNKSIVIFKCAIPCLKVTCMISTVGGPCTLRNGT